MAKELIPTDITNTPEVLRLAEEVARSGLPRLLKREGQELAVLTPVAPPAPTRRRSRRLGQPIPHTDPLFRIVGLGSAEGPSDVSQNPDAYLAAASYEESHPPHQP